MLTDIKNMMGINNNDFDTIITNYISSAKKDLIQVGIAEAKVVESDALIYTAIISYVLSLLDVNNAEMYSSSYALQKDLIRHLSDYTKGE